MIFVPKIHTEYTIEREVIDGHRHYNIIQSDGTKLLFPSMTTILHQEEPEYITAWKANVGEKTAKSISQYATDAGTELHEFCENVLLRNSEKAKEILTTSSRMSKFYMKKILPYLKNINKVLATEEFLFSASVGVAGTVDGVVEYKGTLCILDFKTANMPRAVEDIESYYIQVAGYAAMWEFITGQKIDKGMILLVNSINVQEIPVDIPKYVDKFHALVEQYYISHPHLVRVDTR